jgi:hypothetical protein
MASPLVVFAFQIPCSIYIFFLPFCVPVYADFFRVLTRLCTWHVVILIVALVGYASFGRLARNPRCPVFEERVSVQIVNP